MWSMLTTGALYDEPGPDYYTRHHPERAKNRALQQLADLGYDVTLQPHAGAA
jgi:transposase